MNPHLFVFGIDLLHGVPCELSGALCLFEVSLRDLVSNHKVGGAGRYEGFPSELGSHLSQKRVSELEQITGSLLLTAPLGFA